jgi:hypothetical protein
MGWKALSATSFCLFAVIQMAVAATGSEACDPPRDLWREIMNKYGQTKIVSLSDLDQDDRGFFQKDHDNDCPGLVRVDFYGDGKPTFALVLITQKRLKKDARLVMAHQVGKGWHTVVLDSVEGNVPVVWSEGPGEHRDLYGKKTIRATKPVVIFSRYESWVILYAWVGKKVTKIWIKD